MKENDYYLIVIEDRRWVKCVFNKENFENFNKKQETIEEMWVRCYKMSC